ncbi:hypothetical protein CVT25_002152 [Psilocybe cyanescens]|uniref:Uncharacterized protein n=1 Tax=Psilocybe cyanescens TaxID=93625 RepID=A0A409X0C6_PSICY|nr:hypothetical protein CVT25_002152 [Psilocybe cyanescens]
MKTPLSLMVDLLRHEISTGITELEIKFPLWTYNSLEDVERGLKDHNIKLLDSHLIHPAFDSIRRVIFGVEVEMAKSGSSFQPPSLIEKWRSYVESQLPLLLEKKPDTEVYLFMPAWWEVQPNLPSNESHEIEIEDSTNGERGIPHPDCALHHAACLRPRVGIAPPALPAPEPEPLLAPAPPVETLAVGVVVRTSAFVALPITSSCTLAAENSSRSLSPKHASPTHSSPSTLLC